MYDGVSRGIFYSQLNPWLTTLPRPINKDSLPISGLLPYNCPCTEGIVRRCASGERFIPNVPAMRFFGEGAECSWADALTTALQAMGVKTDYTEVMGVSGACNRLAFCSPTWDYSSVDGLVAYDYATPGYAGFGYTQEMHCHIEKADRAKHCVRITEEIRRDMPVLGINLRVAPEWGVICGYDRDGEDLFCRTKYDLPTINNDPEFMSGQPEFVWKRPNPYDYLS